MGRDPVQGTGQANAGDRVGLYLFQLIADAHGRVYVTTELGSVLRMRDLGSSRELLATGQPA